MFETSHGSASDFRDTFVDELSVAVATRLVEMFGLRDCWFEAFPFDAQMPRIEPGRIVLPAAEPGIAPWAYDAGVELPVRYRGLTLGRFVLAPAATTTGVTFAPRDRAAAIAMAERVGAALGSALVDGTA